MTIQYSKDPLVDRSLRHSVRDGVAYAVMSGGGETYFSAFALYLKATAPQVALLATLPALLGTLAQVLSAWLGHRLGRRRPLMVFGAYAQGLMWLPLLALPLLFPAQAVPLLLVVITLYYAGGNLTAPQWTSLMGDLVPERKRGRYFGRRTRLATMTAFTALVAGGVVLQLFDHLHLTGTGFAVIFLAACAARLVSAWHLAHMHEPHREPAAREMNLGRAWLRAVRGTGALRFSAVFVLMQSAVGIAAPFFAVYMLRDLHFSYLEFMANTGTAVLVQFLTLNTWGRIGDVFGNRLILVATGGLIPLLPLLWLVSPNFWYLLGVQVVSGFAWAGFSLSAGNFLYELVPGTQRATYAAFHNVATAAGTFLGAMAGAGVLHLLPPQPQLLGHAVHWTSNLLAVFALSGAVRALVAWLLLPRLRELRKPRRTLSPRALVFRVSRFNAFSGLLYDIVTLARRRDEGTPPGRQE